jgi:hypothetical protein
MQPVKSTSCPLERKLFTAAVTVGPIFALDPDDSDAGMTSGRVAAEISQTPVEGDEEAAIPLRGVQEHRIVGADQTFVCDGVNIVSERLRHPTGVGGQVLVERQLQPGEGSRGSSASFARRAA